MSAAYSPVRCGVPTQTKCTVSTVRWARSVVKPAGRSPEPLQHLVNPGSKNGASGPIEAIRPWRSRRRCHHVMAELCHASSVYGAEVTASDDRHSCHVLSIRHQPREGRPLGLPSVAHPGSHSVDGQQHGTLEFRFRFGSGRETSDAVE